VVGAAMELWARIGSGERGEESGNDRWKWLLCEVGLRDRDIWAFYAQTGTDDKAVVLGFGRSCAKTCRHTFESRWGETTWL
jgi:hypothetical protein